MTFSAASTSAARYPFTTMVGVLVIVLSSSDTGGLEGGGREGLQGRLRAVGIAGAQGADESGMLGDRGRGGERAQVRR